MYEDDYETPKDPGAEAAEEIKRMNESKLGLSGWLPYACILTYLSAKDGHGIHFPNSWSELPDTLLEYAGLLVLSFIAYVILTMASIYLNAYILPPHRAFTGPGPFIRRVVRLILIFFVCCYISSKV